MDDGGLEKYLAKEFERLNKDLANEGAMDGYQYELSPNMLASFLFVKSIHYLVREQGQFGNKFYMAEINLALKSIDARIRSHHVHYSRKALHVWSDGALLGMIDRQRSGPGYSYMLPRNEEELSLIDEWYSLKMKDSQSAKKHKPKPKPAGAKAIFFQESHDVFYGIENGAGNLRYQKIIPSGDVFEVYVTFVPKGKIMPLEEKPSDVTDIFSMENIEAASDKLKRPYSGEKCFLVDRELLIPFMRSVSSGFISFGMEGETNVYRSSYHQ